MSIRRTVAASLFAIGLAIVPAAHAQFAGTPDPSTFRDTSMLKPPAGHKVAIIEFFDLECPACRTANPIVERAAAQYHVPLVRYDFPLQMHVWSKDAAIFARYLQDRVNPDLANKYRDDVFQQQPALNSKDDLQNFTRRWMQQHGQSMPFSMDPKFAAEVQADYNLGLKLNVTRTPTIVVATANKWQIVSGSESGSNDPNRIFAMVEGALRQTQGAPAPAKAAAHK
ncbi:thioredoxin domain-containing protein [Terriglobus sp. TAA 43]|uniref:DsbA family protein n=1 Tax=Terriglobus sp. TAA 43 TaxID=278961 RepID=UPI000648098B|nr:thioredoxin domain-containing protein [Terriglobus sp. TAA 43]